MKQAERTGGAGRKTSLQLNRVLQPILRTVTSRQSGKTKYRHIMTIQTKHLSAASIFAADGSTSLIWQIPILHSHSEPVSHTYCMFHCVYPPISKKAFYISHIAFLVLLSQPTCTSQLIMFSHLDLHAVIISLQIQTSMSIMFGMFIPNDPDSVIRQWKLPVQNPGSVLLLKIKHPLFNILLFITL